MHVRGSGCKNKTHPVAGGREEGGVAGQSNARQNESGLDVHAGAAPGVELQQQVSKLQECIHSSLAVSSWATNSSENIPCNYFSIALHTHSNSSPSHIMRNCQMQPPTLFCVCWLARRCWQVEATQSSCSCGLQHQHERSPQVTFPCIPQRQLHLSMGAIIKALQPAHLMLAGVHSSQPVIATSGLPDCQQSTSPPVSSACGRTAQAPCLRHTGSSDPPPQAQGQPFQCRTWPGRFCIRGPIGGATSARPDKPALLDSGAVAKPICELSNECALVTLQMC